MDSENSMLLEKTIAEAIQLELKMYQLYTLFQECFPEDAKFWKRLAAEEIIHAETLRKIKSMIELDALMTQKFLLLNWEMLHIENDKMQKVIDDFKNAPNRAKAFNLALELENSASEIHYQSFVTEEKETKLSSVFKTLTGNDKDHAKQIQKYIDEILH